MNFQIIFLLDSGLEQPGYAGFSPILQGIVMDL
jgi:hypothetical protein